MKSAHNWAPAGMGEVYLAEDEQLHRKVALNVQPAEVASDQTSVVMKSAR